MRLLILAAIACAIISLICFAVPTVVLGAGAGIWFVGSWLAFLLDIAFNSPVYNYNRQA